MSHCSEFECLDEEVKELLQNYKHKRATTYEPCTIKNYKECLIGLSEEFGLLNINYVFNPHIDLENDTLRPTALVRFINSVWTLLHFHKNVLDKTEGLVDQNHILEQNNKQLNSIVEKLKMKLNSEKNEAKACVASAQRIADNSDVMHQKLTEVRAKLVQVTKQKEAGEKNLRHEISRLRLMNEKLLKRITKNAAPCNDGCDMQLLRLRDRQKRNEEIIEQLHKNNQELLREVLSMREEILLGGLKDCKLEEKTTNRQ